MIASPEFDLSDAGRQRQGRLSVELTGSVAQIL